ncbi:MAG: hypothetical protein M1817_005339 [Caeruleum heppii]|nr:MAG: hypothetical protein M1817_005339 [Caeruleum heppii]
MDPSSTSTPPIPPPDETKPQDLSTSISRFRLDRVLNQEATEKSILILERQPFPSSSSEDDNAAIRNIISRISDVRTLGENDVYRWFLGSTSPSTTTPTPEKTKHPIPLPPDLKINLIIPCTAAHIRKYSPQRYRLVRETPDVYRRLVRPFVEKKRAEGRLNWVWNILEGRTEQDDVLLREEGGDEGFIVLPDLNWDRTTLSTLHLLALPLRRDLFSLRDLTKAHLPWLRHMRSRILDAVTGLYPSLERDEVLLYFHYQPTYHHLHIHVTHVNLLQQPSNGTQAIGKAFGFDQLLAQLESMGGGDDAGMMDVEIAFVLGEESELWGEVFSGLKVLEEGR